jgi:glutaredoxin 3
MNFEIYTREGCSLCESTKSYLSELEIGYREYVIGKDVTRDMVVETFPGVRMLPIVVVSGKYVGGYEDLLAFLYKNSVD